MKRLISNRILAVILSAILVPLLAVACGGDDDRRRRDGHRNVPNFHVHCHAGDARPDREVTLRLGYFANVTHAQALVGVAEGYFEEALGQNVKIEVTTFNAGPAVIEALFAGEIDISYIGPNPAINGYVQSKGEALRIVAGSASAGARFIVRPDANINTTADLADKTIATPQLGNTQDVALRAYLAENGLETKEKGGNVTVQPSANADTLTLFQQGSIDGAWVPEPWATRLELEAGGVQFLDEREIWPDGEFVTTHVIVATEFLEENPDVVEKFLEGHVRATEFVSEDTDRAKAIVNAEIERLTKAALPQEVIDGAWENLTFTVDPISSSLVKSAADAYELGFLEDEPNLDGIYALDILNAVLAEAGLAAVES